MTKSILSIGALLVWVLLSHPALATDRYVAVDGGGSNDGVCTNSGSPCLSIQHAVTNANSNDTIYVAAGTYNESVSITKNLTLIGEATATTIIDGQSTDYCVESDSAPSSPTIIMRKFTIQNCEHVNTGAAVYVVGDFSTPSLTLEDIYFYNNFISTDAGFGPGGVYFGSGNALILNRVTFENNHGPKGAAILIASSTSATLTNVTFINNNSTVNPTDDGNYNASQGGAVWTNSNTTINNSTFYNNVSSAGNAIYRSSNTVTVKNSILTGTGNDCSGTVTSGGHNLVSDTSCSFSGTGDVESVADMGLVALTDNGGEVKTMSLDEDSPAVDSGDNASCSSEDARSESRPFDSDFNGTATCDIGAYEVVCGDGITDFDEECDDGNNSNTDSCTNQCKNAVCGDGYIEAGEEACDDGDDNSDIDADACRTDCTEAACGDGVVDSLETCDDANNVNNDGCLNSCAVATCGDGVVQLNAEVCDDGDDNSNVDADACRTTCVASSCGDGVVDTGEECDDGNSLNTDSCLNSCELAYCGDGNLQSDSDEECDDGDDNSDVDADACRTTCVTSSCGDGVVDDGEECDDENSVNDDDCTNTCTNNITTNESLCGNDTVDEDEECDDGNTNDVDGCSSSCAFESFDDLSNSNPNINFSSLTTGQTITLTFPDININSSRSTPLLLSETDSSTCDCSWTVSPSSFANIDDSTSCTPALTITGSNQANLAVSVECEGSNAVSGNQTLIVATSSSNSSTTTSAASCQLQSTATSNSNQNQKSIWTIFIFSLIILKTLAPSLPQLRKPL